MGYVTLSNHYFTSVLDIHTLLCGLACKFPSVKRVPLIARIRVIREIRSRNTCRLALAKVKDEAACSSTVVGRHIEVGTEAFQCACSRRVPQFAAHRGDSVKKCETVIRYLFLFSAAKIRKKRETGCEKSHNGVKNRRMRCENSTNFHKFSSFQPWKGLFFVQINLVFRSVCTTFVADMERLTLGAMQFTAVALMTPTQFLLQQSKR